MSEDRKKIVVALSGGVDSAVTASLLLDQGFEVVGAFMKNWSGDSGKSPCWVDDRRDAIAVAAHLGISMVTFDFEQAFQKEVVDYLYREYEAGRTPNPDIICNRAIKFDLFWKEAEKLGAWKIATGHYAQVLERDGHFELHQGVDPHKDQTYFLHQLSEEQLSHVLFPLGNFLKRDVREIARKRGFEIADKRSSRGICFVGKVPLPKLLREKIAPKKGLVITTDGVTVGEHDGIFHFTIGQRHGFNVAGRQALYVAEKRADTNTLVVAEGAEHPALFAGSCRITMHWINGPSNGKNLMARIRHQHEGVSARVTCEQDGNCMVSFATPQFAVAPGQFVVLYRDSHCIGGGEIVSRSILANEFVLPYTSPL